MVCNPQAVLPDSDSGAAKNLSVEVVGDHQIVAGIAPLGWAFAGVLVLALLICWAAGRGRIPRNDAVGIRLPSLQRDDRAWQAGHAAAVRPALVGCLATVLCSVLGLVNAWLYVAAAAAGAGTIVWVCIAAVRAARAS